MKKVLTILFILMIGISLIDIQATFSQNTDSIINERNLRNAILGKTWFSDNDLNQLDLNDDAVINVSDLIYYLFNRKDFISFIGEHVGILWRDNADFVEGQSKDIGQIPFCLRITNDSPQEGYIDNLPDSGNDYSNYYSLYFPKQTLPVNFLIPDETDDLKFEIQFHTSASNIAPQFDLERRMIFRGKFLDGNSNNILSGNYQEHISGFKDNYGEDIPIKLTGKFMLIFSDTDQQTHK